MRHRVTALRPLGSISLAAAALMLAGSAQAANAVPDPDRPVHDD